MTDTPQPSPGTTGRPLTMASLRHTHSDHDTRDWLWFHRGPAVAADGGQRADDDEEEEEVDEMRDVSHTREDDAHANRVWDGTRVRETDGE